VSAKAHEKGWCRGDTIEPNPPRRAELLRNKHKIEIAAERSKKCSIKILRYARKEKQGEPSGYRSIHLMETYSAGNRHAGRGFMWREIIRKSGRGANAEEGGRFRI